MDDTEGCMLHSACSFAGMDSRGAAASWLAATLPLTLGVQVVVAIEQIRLRGNPNHLGLGLGGALLQRGAHRHGNQES